MKNIKAMELLRGAFQSASGRRRINSNIGRIRVTFDFVSRQAARSIRPSTRGILPNTTVAYIIFSTVPVGLHPHKIINTFSLFMSISIANVKIQMHK